jgi:PKD repeat protein
MNFNADPTDASNSVLNYTWDFGDGVTVDGANATHAYTHAGIYTARLQCSGFAPQLSVQTFTVTITDSIATKFVPARQRRFVEGKP